MELYHDNRLAVLYYDDDLLASCGATADDTEGLVNLPLGARDVVTTTLIKKQSDGTFRVSLRSKGNIDVRAVAQIWGGGGHTNASGCTITEDLQENRRRLIEAVGKAIVHSE
jgi:phosphoesterase RecJ-like protein